MTQQNTAVTESMNAALTHISSMNMSHLEEMRVAASELSPITPTSTVWVRTINRYNEESNEAFDIAACDFNHFVRDSIEVENEDGSFRTVKFSRKDIAGHVRENNRKALAKLVLSAADDEKKTRVVSAEIRVALFQGDRFVRTVSLPLCLETLKQLAMGQLLMSNNGSLRQKPSKKKAKKN